jgi:hypothetical protein
MNTLNASLFVGFGMIMEIMHLSSAITGTRELWLMVMGAVMMLTGGAFLAQEAWLWVKPRMITPLTAWATRPAAVNDGRAAPQAGRRASV